MSAPVTSRLALVALIVLSLIWGYNWVVMKQVIQYVDPFDFSALRMLLGAATLFAALLLGRRPLGITALPQVILLGMLQTAAFTALMQWALVSSGAGKTAVLVYTMPFWLIVLAWWLLDERARGLQWLASALAAAGLVLILQPWQRQGDLVGNVLAVAAGLVWALSVVLAKRMRQRHAFDLLALTAWQMLFGALALCVLAWILPSARELVPTPYFFGALAYNAILASGLGWLIWLYVLQHLSAGMAGLSVLGIPLIGVLAGWIELGERPGQVELVGMILVVTALALISVVAAWQGWRQMARRD